MIGQTGILDEINKLIRLYFDAKEDYRLAGGRAGDDPKLQERLYHLCQVRERQHKELQEIITQMNVEMSDNGHVGADFKREWERLRGSITGHGLANALQLARKSDVRAVELSRALLNTTIPDPLKSTIATHVQEIESALPELDRTLADVA
jgi:uncharacterized protein (TIGR02284 family)